MTVDRRQPDRVELFHVGPPKTGTTWIYTCLAEHPGIAVPPTDSIHFFNMHFDRGDAWYLSRFGQTRAGQKRFDPTPGYFRSPWAARRMAAHNPDARVAICLRHPIDRAFSHYWHEKKKGRHRYDFADVLRNYDLFASWMEPGFYAEHLERFLEHFPRSQILVQHFDEIERNPGGFLTELLAFFGVGADFSPSARDRTINVAGPRRTAVGLGLYSVQKALRVGGFSRSADRLGRSRWLSGRGEYLRGVPDDLRRRLQEICEPEIARLERLLGRDLQAWRPTRRRAA